MTILFVSFLIGCLGALLSLLTPAKYRITVASLAIIAEGFLSTFAALVTIYHQKQYSFTSQQIIPFFGIKLTLTPLSAYFILVTAFLSISVGLYQFGYAKHAVNARTTVFLFPIFITSMLLIPLSDSVATFMGSWELMAITSILLVLTDHKTNRRVGNATQWYSIMTHLGAASIFFGLIVLVVATGHQEFLPIGKDVTHLSAVEKFIAFFLLFLGFGSKAGVVPLHIWLPHAHPQAPSPVSAVMSGAMINLGIYGLLRFNLMLLHNSSNWWWIVVVATGAVTAIYGSLQCAINSDLKQLLAYSTVDNVGLMVVGIGVSGLLVNSGHTNIATLMIIGVLFQLLAHSIFKGLLFLTAGAIHFSTNTFNIDKLGGLLRKLPAISICMLIGVASISAIPPFSGFSSEFILFEGLFKAISNLTGINSIAALLGLSGFALAGGLTATAFVKTAGISLLGINRSDQDLSKDKIPKTMVAGSLILALSCLLIGIFPNLSLEVLLKPSRLIFANSSLKVSNSLGSIDITKMTSNVQPLILLCVFIIVVALVIGISQLYNTRRIRTANSWGCGSNYANSKTQYTATSFAGPLLKVFEDVIRPDHDITSTPSEESKYYVKSVKYTYHFHDSVERLLYQPIKRFIIFWGNFTSKIQNGSTHRYIAFGFIAVIALLVFLT